MKTALDLKYDAKSINYLFFAARNGAIETLLTRIRKYFKNISIGVECSWHESSFYGSASIEITLDGKNPCTRRIYLDRRVFGPKPIDGASECYYEFKTVVPGEYYHRRKPKAHIEFDEILSSEEFASFIRSIVPGVNFPFKYTSWSSF